MNPYIVPDYLPAPPPKPAAVSLSDGAKTFVASLQAQIERDLSAAMTDAKNSLEAASQALPAIQWPTPN